MAYKDREKRLAYSREYMRRKLAAMTPEQRRERCEKTKAWRKANPDKLAKYNRENKAAIYAARAKWRREHPERVRMHTRAHNFRQKYGLEIDEVNAILATQNGRCNICGDPVKFGRSGSAVVDHCHKTDKVRSILCSCCNTGIGQFKEDPVRLQAAIEYLKRHSVH